MRVEMREVTLRSSSPIRADSSITRITNHSCELSYPVMMSMVYLLATADTSPSVELMTPSTV